MAYSTTTNHDVIRSWVERHGGQPAILKGTSSPDYFGTLRIDFTDDPNLVHISWNAFFDQFESQRLAFHYDTERDGSPERQFKLVNRDDVAADDETQLPDAGDQEMARENMYPSAPVDDHHNPDTTSTAGGTE